MGITVRTPKAFASLIKKDPAAAQAWLKEVASHSDGLLPKAQLDALKKLSAMKVDAFVKHSGAFDVSSLFSAQAVAPVDDPSTDLPVLHGRLTVDRGTRVQAGEQGYREWPDLKLTLKADDGRTFSLESDHNQRQDIFQFIPGTDVMAFDGQDVSLRGYLDESGKALRVTEFAPGKLADFVTGRVVLEGDEVFVRARGRGLLKVTDPGLKKQLKSHGNLGIILEGKTSEHRKADGTVSRTFDGKPQEYWMLVRFTEAPSPSGQGKVSGPIQAATSRTSTRVELSPAEAKHIEVNDRMYVLGRFHGDVVRASKATPSAGSPWLTASHGRADPMKSVIAFTEAQAPV